MVALVPGIMAYIFLFGYGVLLNITIAIITALIAEYFILKIRNSIIISGNQNKVTPPGS